MEPTSPRIVPLRDGADSVNLGAGLDRVLLGGRSRVTFDLFGVGNGLPTDTGGRAGQDGGLAVRVQALDSAGNPVGPVSRLDDEGVAIDASQGGNIPLEAVDLVTGFQFSTRFKNVVLGTAGNDVLSGGSSTRTDASVSGLVVGGAGDDILSGLGDSILIGGTGIDTVATSCPRPSTSSDSALTTTGMLSFATAGGSAARGR
jgi:hypothetical protein